MGLFSKILGQLTQTGEQRGWVLIQTRSYGTGVGHLAYKGRKFRGFRRSGRFIFECHFSAVLIVLPSIQHFSM
jgi:hypothetical protein